MALGILIAAFIVFALLYQAAEPRIGEKGIAKVFITISALLFFATLIHREIITCLAFFAVSLRGPEIRTQLRQLRTKYESMIVDVGGRDTASLRAPLTVTDILVVPVLPASFDVWSLEPLADLIQEAREINSALSVIAVLHAGDAQGKDNAHLKLTRYLLRVTRDARYGDSMERVMYNTVLGAKPLQDNGESFYSQITTSTENACTRKLAGLVVRARCRKWRRIIG